jgi:hypothetical protein
MAEDIQGLAKVGREHLEHELEVKTDRIFCLCEQYKRGEEERAEREKDRIYFKMSPNGDEISRRDIVLAIRDYNRLRREMWRYGLDTAEKDKIVISYIGKVLKRTESN